MSNFQLIKNADVQVQSVRDEKKRECAAIVVNDRFQHVFPHSSRVSKHLDVMRPEQLANRLTGGQFFFIEDELVDWRDGQYNGFVHDLDTIGLYMDMFGYIRKDDLSLKHRKKNSEQDILLRAVWDKNDIQVPGYAMGGKFFSELSFVWNPFTSHINSSFDLVRQICTNGMIGLTSFLNTKIPLFNRQTEHLDIAARQIQNKVSNIVIERVQTMNNERASVGQCLLLDNHITDRLSTAIDANEHTRLLGLLHAVSPKAQLSEVYKDNVFDNKDLAAQLPAHLTCFDIFNVATELRTHTGPSRNSSDFALDKFANGLLFDNDGSLVTTGNRSKMNLASFSDADRAFFGDLAA